MPAIKKTKSSVATNFYLHCNIILCGLEGSKRGEGEEGRRKGGKERGGEGEGGGKGGWWGRIHPATK